MVLTFREADLACRVYTPGASASMRTDLNSAAPSFSFTLFPPATLTLAAAPLPSDAIALGSKLTCNNHLIMSCGFKRAKRVLSEACCHP